MATWLGKNTYVTSKGQVLINKAAAGIATIEIRGAVATNEFFTGKQPFERKLSDMKVAQRATGIQLIPASAEISSTAQIIQCEFDSSVESSREITDEYYLRGIGIIAREVGTTEDILMVWSECIKTDPDLSVKGDADTIPDVTATRVVQTYAFQLDNFELDHRDTDESSAPSFKVVNSGAGLLTGKQVQEQIDRRFTNPVFGKVRLGGESVVVGNEQTGSAAKVVSTIETVSDDLTVDLPVALHKGAGNTIKVGQDHKLSTRVFIPENTVYTVGALFYNNTAFSNYNIVVQVDGNKSTFNAQSDWKNYSSAENTALYSLRAEYDLSAGWHNISIYIEESKNFSAYNVTLGLVAMTVRKGNIVNSVVDTEFDCRMSAVEFSNESLNTVILGENSSLPCYKMATITFVNVDSELLTYFPVISKSDDYATSTEVSDLVENTKNTILDTTQKELLEKNYFNGFILNGGAGISNYLGNSSVNLRGKIALPLKIVHKNAVFKNNCTVNLDILMKTSTNAISYIVGTPSFVFYPVEVPYDGEYTVGVLYYSNDPSIECDLQIRVRYTSSTSYYTTKVLLASEYSGENYLSVSHVEQGYSLKSYTATLNLRKGLNFIRVGQINVNTVIDLNTSTSEMGISSVVIGTGNNLANSTIISRHSAVEFCSTEQPKEIWDIPNESWFPNYYVYNPITVSLNCDIIDDEFLTYFPYVATLDPYVPMSVIGDMDYLIDEEGYDNVIQCIKTILDVQQVNINDINSISAQLRKNFGEYRGYVPNGEPIPNSIGWYIIDQDHIPNEPNFPDIALATNYKAYLLNLPSPDTAEITRVLLTEAGGIYVYSARGGNENLVFNNWNKVPLIDSDYSNVVINPYTSEGGIAVVSEDNDGEIVGSGVAISDLMKANAMDANQANWNGLFPTGKSLNTAAVSGGRNNTGYWLISGANMPTDMPTVILPDGTSFTPTTAYLRVENLSGGSTKACKQSLICTGEHPCTIVRYSVDADNYTEWAVEMDSNNTTQTSLKWSNSDITGNEPKGTMQLVTTVPWYNADIDDIWVNVTTGSYYNNVNDIEVVDITVNSGTFILKDGTRYELGLVVNLPMTYTISKEYLEMEDELFVYDLRGSYEITPEPLLFLEDYPWSAGLCSYDTYGENKSFTYYMKQPPPSKLGFIETGEVPSASDITDIKICAKAGGGIRIINKMYLMFGNNTYYKATPKYRQVTTDNPDFNCYVGGKFGPKILKSEAYNIAYFENAQEDNWDYLEEDTVTDDVIFLHFDNNGSLRATLAEIRNGNIVNCNTEDYYVDFVGEE